MMEEPREAPSYEEEIQAYLSWVDGVQSFEVIDPDTNLMRPFVVADAMKNYFEENNYQRLKKIIALHFPAEPDGLFADDVVPNNVAVFSTLLGISKGWWMKHFRHHNDLSDTALPFDPARPPPNWPQGADFLPKFCEAQWKFCAPVLRAPFVGQRFPKDMVLPIVWKETLNTEGSSASLWCIKIHPSYNNLISDSDKGRLGKHANTFVMKTYFTSEAEKYYNTEVVAFRHLGLNPSIIKFYGSFTRGDSYNVLLEYADKGTLADYFKREAPPSEGDEIIRFWEVMFQLLDALRRIHEVRSDDQNGGADGPRVFQGRHQDVKPENVLIVSNGSENRGDWVFKLADLGISKFKGKRPGRQDSADKHARGTRTYGAPESYRPDGTYVHDTLREGQNSDVWSLGCIYSEAVRWLKDGHRGIEAYRQERLRETSQLQGFRDGDCFHDGEKMLTCVRKCHKNSVQHLRPEDTITGPVIEGLITDMLGQAEARSTAFALYHKSKSLIRNAQEDLVAVRAGPEPTALQKYPSRPRNRSVTAPVHDSRPAPPNPPPSHFHGINLHAIPQNTDAFTSSYFSSSNNNSPSHVFDSSNTTAEPETVESLPLSPKSPSTSHGSGELPSQGLHGLPTIIHDEVRDASATSNNRWDRRPDTGKTSTRRRYDASSARSSAHEPTSFGVQARLSAGHGSSSSQNSHLNHVVAEPDIRRESPSPPGSSAAAAAPYQFPTNTTDEPTIPPRLSHSCHVPPGNMARPKPVVIQGHPPPPLPYLSLDDALDWRRNRKGNRSKTPLQDRDYLDRLKDRDHVFLIDDSATMKQHWKDVLKVFEVLSYIVKEVDPDGFDLWFTGPSKPLQRCTKTTPPLQTVEVRKKQGTTDINNKLNLIFEDYIEALKKPRTGLRAKFTKPVKSLSLYVFTDGIWEKDCSPRHVVETFVGQLEALNKVKGKVGIQFISFGEDPVGLARMELLDSGLDVKLDIVDTEPCKGNVWKMLLGAINDSFDKIHDKFSSEENGASSSHNGSNRMSMAGGGGYKEEYS